MITNYYYSIHDKDGKYINYFQSAYPITFILGQIINPNNNNYYLNNSCVVTKIESHIEKENTQLTTYVYLD